MLCPNYYVMGAGYDQYPECDDCPEFLYQACGQMFCGYDAFRTFIRENSEESLSECFISEQFHLLTSGIRGVRIHDLALQAWSHIN